MTTAREQIAQRVKDLRKRQKEEFGEVWITPQNGADLASDVWEPIVRDLLVHHDAACEASDCYELDTAVRRAKEALGDDT